MTWKTTDPRIGLSNIPTVDSSATVDVGTIVRAEDPLYGAGEFIYLPGVASCVAGSLVRYNPENYTSANPPVLVGSTTLLPSTAVQAGPFAVSVNTLTAGQFSWFQISGATIIRKMTTGKVQPNSALWIGATAGKAKGTASAGKQLLGVKSINSATVASATTTVLAVINRPHVQGQIT